MRKEVLQTSLCAQTVNYVWLLLTTSTEIRLWLNSLFYHVGPSLPVPVYIVVTRVCVIQSKKKKNNKIFQKIERNNCELLDTTLFPLPATMLFSWELCLTDMFAKESWSCVLLLHREERWRVSVKSSSFRWTLNSCSRGRSVLLCVPTLMLSFVIVCIFISSPPPLLLACSPMTAAAWVEQTRLSHWLWLPHVPKHTELHGYKGQLHVLCLLACRTANNHELSRQPRVFTATQQNMRRGGVQCLARE